MKQNCHCFIALIFVRLVFEDEYPLRSATSLPGLCCLYIRPLYFAHIHIPPHTQRHTYLCTRARAHSHAHVRAQTGIAGITEKTTTDRHYPLLVTAV